MATRSWSPSPAHSPVDQGQLESLLPPASPELGKVSLKQVIHLLWGLQSQVDCIDWTLLEQNEINQEVCTNVKNILQAVDVVKDGLAQLQLTQGCTQSQTYWQGSTIPWGPAPIISTGAPQRNPLSLFNPYPSSSFPLGLPPAAPAAPPAAPQVTLAPPPAPSTVEVDHPDAIKGKIGLEAKQWLTRMLAWVCLNQRQFSMDLEFLSCLLMNMMEAGRPGLTPIWTN
ncbi:hypothetical protein RhiXN_07955 [Rhizoctonia solani]|uniref:Uncharacterized protein n=1 Tax=Rhizoctonia solani TaxID=456999 RepID=A0A8H8SYV6_9AGAM|nr:uncharacterized protein RhiXN_07955 [Rhizoctonia solani]QRW22919.1 hypothetical protein RhiXN_07955 [Rhizoctonia solani]